VKQAQAFGVNFTFPDDLWLDGLCPPSASLPAPPTELRRDPTTVADRWSGARAERMRELREGDTVFSVDHDPERGWLVQASGTGAAFLAADGLTVECAPAPDSGDWNALLGGQVLPLVATLRGLEAFHAAGVVWEGRANLLCAAQGVGKTSLAAHLVMTGAQLLSDDVVAVDGDLVAHPGLTVLNVRGPERQRVERGAGAALGQLKTVNGRTGFVARDPAGAHPVGAIYLLARAEAGEAFERVPNPTPVDLLRATFNVTVQSSARLIRQLDLCGRLVAEVPIFRVRIVPDQPAAELADMLLAHMTHQQMLHA
jgi:hypothetical protein